MLKVSHKVQEALYDAIESLGEVRASGPALAQLATIENQLLHCLLLMDERTLPDREVPKKK